MIKGIIFDLDGVLCSTDEYHYRAWKALAEREQIPFDRELYQSLLGISRMESLERILESAGRRETSEKKRQLAEEKDRIYCMLLQQLSPQDVKEEVWQTLRELKRQGVRLAVGSSSKNTKRILRQTELMEWFDAISDGTNITHSKPHPEVFWKAAQMLDLSPEECMVVEDSHAGIEAAYTGGFHSAAIGTAVHDPAAEYHLESLWELVDICGSLNNGLKTTPEIRI